MILSDKLSFFIDTLRHLLPHCRHRHRQCDNGCVLKEILLINLIIIISLSATTSRECVDRISINLHYFHSENVIIVTHNHIFAPKMIKVTVVVIAILDCYLWKVNQALRSTIIEIGKFSPSNIIATLYWIVKFDVEHFLPSSNSHFDTSHTEWDLAVSLRWSR